MTRGGRWVMLLIEIPGTPVALSAAPASLRKASRQNRRIIARLAKSFSQGHDYVGKSRASVERAAVVFATYFLSDYLSDAVERAC